MLFGFYAVNTVFPVWSFCQLRFQRFHNKSFTTLLRITRTNIGTVTATQTVEYTYLNTESHVGKLLTYSFQSSEAGFFLFFLIQNERTNTSVRTNVCTFVTLYTVFRFPFRYKCCNTTFFVFSSALLPCSVFNSFEC